MFHEGDLVAMRYRILGALGRGGMGVVYRAEHVALRRQVALKVLGTEFMGTDMERRFEREARTAARLDHPGCVRVLDHGRTVDRKLYLAMELIDGPTLAGWMAQAGALRIGDAIRTANELLSALAYAHGQGVLHRDVKPENTMFARRGDGTRVVLIDFGLAQLRDDAGITQRGACMGSPSYVAPERLLGVASDERADLYSVGIVLYEMLTAQRPFGSGAPMDIAMRQVQDPPPDLAAARPDLPAALVGAVIRALDKDPARRFASAEDMRTALGRVAQPVPARITRTIAALPAPPPLPLEARPPSSSDGVAHAATVRAGADVPVAHAASVSPTPTAPRAASVSPTPTAPRATSVPPTPPEEVAATLAWRLNNGSLWRRLLAWWRHGAWRWREGSMA
jgi:eukaryotic-like serine/threonine-protein kinase